jgi:hypothetical protein
MPSFTQPVTLSPKRNKLISYLNVGFTKTKTKTNKTKSVKRKKRGEKDAKSPLL